MSILSHNLWYLMVLVVMMGASAAENTAHDFVRQTTRDLLGALGSHDSDTPLDADTAVRIVETYVGPHLDIEGASKFVLGQHWRRAPRKTQQRFAKAFHRLTVRTIANAIPRLAGASFKIHPSRKKDRGRTTLVRTTAQPPSGASLRVDFRVRQTKGKWSVMDFTIEGLSLLSTYRTEFRAIISDQGIDDLVETMESRANSQT